MSLFTYGINHRSAPIAVREKLSFDAAQLTTALQNLVKQDAINEAVILSTCNRTEIYADITHLPELEKWLAQQKKILDVDLTAYGYSHHDADAVRHIMRVASGLDSAVIGEPQVLGQMKEAYRIAQEAGAIGDHLKHLFPAVFEASKHIRTNTEIGSHSVSLAYAITQLSKNIYTSLSHCNVLLIGAGETIELVATHLHGIGVKKIIIANRTIEKTQHLTQTLNAEAIEIRDIPTYITESDIVVSATASRLPIIGKGLIETILKQRKNRPLLLVDLALPRDIEPEIAELNHVHLYNLDDLQNTITESLKSRMDAAKQAEKIIELETDHFIRKMRVFHARHIITGYRDQLEKIRLNEQAKALQKLQLGHDPQMVLEQFGHSLINKIMHHPTVKLREAASENECEVFQRIKTFFEIK